MGEKRKVVNSVHLIDIESFYRRKIAGLTHAEEVHLVGYDVSFMEWQGDGNHNTLDAIIQLIDRGGTVHIIMPRIYDDNVKRTFPVLDSLQAHFSAKNSIENLTIDTIPNSPFLAPEMEDLYFEGVLGMIGIDNSLSAWRSDGAGTQYQVYPYDVSINVIHDLQSIQQENDTRRKNVNNWLKAVLGTENDTKTDFTLVDQDDYFGTLSRYIAQEDRFFRLYGWDEGMMQSHDVTDSLRAAVHNGVPIKANIPEVHVDRLYQILNLPYDSDKIIADGTWFGTVQGYIKLGNKVASCWGGNRQTMDPEKTEFIRRFYELSDPSILHKAVYFIKTVLKNDK